MVLRPELNGGWGHQPQRRQDWHESWQEPRPGTTKAPISRGFLKYRYRDSNPGFRHERAAS